MEKNNADKILGVYNTISHTTAEKVKLSSTIQENQRK